MSDSVPFKTIEDPFKPGTTTNATQLRALSKHLNEIAEEADRPDRDKSKPVPFKVGENVLACSHNGQG